MFPPATKLIVVTCCYSSRPDLSVLETNLIDIMNMSSRLNPCICRSRVKTRYLRVVRLAGYTTPSAVPYQSMLNCYINDIRGACSLTTFNDVTPVSASNDRFKVKKPYWQCQLTLDQT